MDAIAYRTLRMAERAALMVARQFQLSADDTEAILALAAVLVAVGRDLDREGFVGDVDDAMVEAEDWHRHDAQCLVGDLDREGFESQRQARTNARHEDRLQRLVNWMRKAADMIRDAKKDSAMGHNPARLLAAESWKAGWDARGEHEGDTMRGRADGSPPGS